MSLKQEIETWVDALEHYDKQDYETALKSFEDIAETSKILFNCGVIHATLGEHDKAVECYQKAVGLDKYLAVAYFQQGVSNFLVGDFEEALANFNDTLLYLRGHRYIDYDQLGLKFKLYSCEALFNRGLCYIYLQAREAGMNDLIFASKEKETDDHDVIDEAIKEQAEGYTVFSIPVGVVYRPNASKVKNLKTKDYLGKARLIASTDKSNTHTNFAGSEKKMAEMAATVAGQEREKDKISYAASTLVRGDLQSRGHNRQQSEPPLNRNIYPPTPPPEDSSRVGGNNMSSARSIAPSESASLSSRANSVRSGTAAYRVNRQASNATAPPPATVPEDEVVASPPTLPASAFNPSEPADVAPLASPPASMKSQQRPRLSALRTGSEPPRRANTFDDSNYGPGRARNQNDEVISPRSRGTPTRQRLYGEVLEEDPEDADDEEFQDNLYDLYSKTARQNPFTNQRSPQDSRPSQPAQRREKSRTRAHSRARSTSRRPSARVQRDQVTSVYPSESDEAPRSGHSSLEDFEMLNNASGGVNGPPPVPSLQTQHRRGQSQAAPSQGIQRTQTMPMHSRMNSYAGQPTNFGGEVTTIRVKLHHADETRYLMVSAATGFEAFEARAKEKLKVKGGLKIKMRDDEDGDLITVGDADDWEMAMEGSRREAMKAGDEMGRLEVWATDV